MERLLDLNPILLAFIATMITWFLTFIGATSAFYINKIRRRSLHIMLGFAAGEMLSASFWSLLNHSIEMTYQLGDMSIASVAIGFLLGGLFIWSLEHIMPWVHRKIEERHHEEITPEVRAQLFVSDILVHYLPEGLALGIAFGALYHNFEFITIAGAIGLMIGLGSQNIIEAAAMAVPIKRLGISKMQSFKYVVISGVVQPIAGIIGALIVMIDYHVLAFSLSFAAGAMIYGVVEELLPEAFKDDDRVAATISLMVGFTVMMLIKVTIEH